MEELSRNLLSAHIERNPELCSKFSWSAFAWSPLLFFGGGGRATRLEGLSSQTRD